MPRIKLFNQEEVLLKAMDLFWEKGYKGTSLGDLTRLLDIGKGSFYNTFKSKRALFEQCINSYRNNSINSLMEILKSEKDVKKGLQNFLKINLEYAINDPKQRGCFLSNTCAELAHTDAPMNQSMNEHYSQMKMIIKDYLASNSDLENDRIHLIAHTIITFFIGMTVEVKLHQQQNQIEWSIQHLIDALF
jgi:TetR/AcrR family transcriptional repressor of nem operon